MKVAEIFTSKPARAKNVRFLVDYIIVFNNYNYSCAINARVNMPISNAEAIVYSPRHNAYIKLELIVSCVSFVAFVL